MAPSAGALVHLPAQELHPDCLQLPHRGGEIVDQEADRGDWWRSARGPGRPGPNTSKVPASGSWKAVKSGLLLAGGQARTAWRNAPRAGYSLVLVPTQPMHLTRILVAPPLRSLASAILLRRSWLS